MIYPFLALTHCNADLAINIDISLPQKSGAAIVSDSERDKTLVQELLELKAKVDGIIVKAFKNNAQFQSVVREGFESVINRRQNKPAELIGTVP